MSRKKNLYKYSRKNWRNFQSLNSLELFIKVVSSCEMIKLSIDKWEDWQITRCAREHITQFSSIYIYSRSIPLNECTHTCCDSGMITDDLSVTGCRYRGWIIVLIAKYEIIRERDRRPSIIGQRWPLVRRRSFIILAQPSPSSYSHRIADVPLFVYRT